MQGFPWLEMVKHSFCSTQKYSETQVITNYQMWISCLSAGGLQELRPVLPKGTRPCGHHGKNPNILNVLMVDSWNNDERSTSQITQSDNCKLLSLFNSKSFKSQLKLNIL
uniref:Uncharacterized protein n=1 Tax=Sphaerodactylus townsendi TaxID=933632 RepID=A0ACB8F537_9SAUR